MDSCERVRRASACFQSDSQDGAILLRAAVPFNEKWPADLNGRAAFICSYPYLGVNARDAYLANSDDISANALNSSALPDGSRKNIVACSPTSPLKRTCECAQVAHHAFVEYLARCGQIAFHRQVHAALHVQPLRTGSIATVAMTAMRCFGEDLGDLAERLPTVTDIFHSIQVTFRFGEVIEECDLHTLFDEGLAGERGVDFLLAVASHHHTARPAHALGHGDFAFEEFGRNFSHVRRVAL